VSETTQQIRLMQLVQKINESDHKAELIRLMEEQVQDDTYKLC
jgi:hypothetical protein